MYTKWYVTGSSEAGPVHAEGTHENIVPWPENGANENTMANAHLIAASPDGFALIDTLNAILTQFPDGRHVNWHSIKADCEAYLRKVKGE